MTEKTASQWYQAWQDRSHASVFDARSRLSDRALVGAYESFSDVLLLGKILSKNPRARLAEVGCATGEFYRYLKRRHPWVTYGGIDISRVAIQRAKEKYPQGSFTVHPPDASLADSLRSAGFPEQVEVIYSKDVVHHQTDPFGLLGQLLEHATEALVVRLRTRDSGQTVLDPELSCQYNYRDWAPFLVLNVDETVRFLQQKAPEAELVLCRSYQVLGGQENRYLPKECYLPETGTAETAVAVLRKSGNPGKVSFRDNFHTSVPPGLRSAAKEAVKRLARGWRQPAWTE